MVTSCIAQPIDRNNPGAIIQAQERMGTGRLCPVSPQVSSHSRSRQNAPHGKKRARQGGFRREVFQCQRDAKPRILHADFDRQGDLQFFLEAVKPCQVPASKVA